MPCTSNLICLAYWLYKPDLILKMQLRKYVECLALFLFQHQRLSLGKALEIAEMSNWEFADINRQLGIPIRYTQQELEEDMNRLAYV